MKKRIVVFILILCLLLSTFSVYGQNPDLNKLQKDKEAINKKIELTKKSKTQKEKEKKTLSKQIEELEKKAI